MAVMIWDAVIVFLWGAVLGFGVKLWALWLRPAPSRNYRPEAAPSPAVVLVSVVVAAIAVGLSRIPVLSLALVLTGLTVIVIIIMAPLTVSAYRDRPRRR
jgi:hypothetical protein